MTGVGADGASIGSICPQGWTLPPNAGDGSYNNLLTTIYGLSGSDYAKLVAAPFDFAYTGYYNYSSGALDSTGYGFHWSRTAKDASNAYNLYFRSGYAKPQDDGNRGNGVPVRCVARRASSVVWYTSLPVPSSSKLLALPLEFGYTGFLYYSYGYLASDGSYGYYWYRTAVSGSNARVLAFYASNVTPQGSGSRGDGRAVRCLASLILLTLVLQNKIVIEWRGGPTATLP